MLPIITAEDAEIKTVYIHERKDWPEFRWDAKALADQVTQVRYHQGRLLGRMESLGFPLRQEAVLASLTQEVARSSEIEGELLNLQSVRSSLARHLGIVIAGLTPSDRHVDGIVEMMLDAVGRFREPLTARRLFGWHAALFPTGRSGMAKITTGAWRNDRSGAMQVVSGPIGKRRVHFEAPAAKRLRVEMRRFLDWFNHQPPAGLLTGAALAHLWFVTIHPFDDGNGRIARAITDLLLARSEGTDKRFYSMSAQIMIERDAYYEVLESTQKGSMDVTPWLQWFLSCLDRAFGHSESMLASVLQRARFWEFHSSQALNYRQRLVLARLLDGFEGKLTSSMWAKLAKCSQDTALRDIEQLVQWHILQRDPAGGRSTSYSLILPDRE